MEYKSDNVLSIIYRKVDPNMQLIFSFKNDLPDWFYAYDWDIRKNATPGKGVNIYLCGECRGPVMTVSLFTGIGVQTRTKTVKSSLWPTQTREEVGSFACLVKTYRFTELLKLRGTIFTITIDPLL